MPNPVKKTRKNIPQKEVIALARQGQTTTEIALTIGCTQGAVSKVLARAGVRPVRSKGQRGAGRDPIRPDRLSRIDAALVGGGKVSHTTARRIAAYLLEQRDYYHDNWDNDNTIQETKSVIEQAVTSHLKAMLSKPYRKIVSIIANNPKYNSLIRQQIRECGLYDYYDTIAARGIDPRPIFHPHVPRSAPNPEKTTKTQARRIAQIENRASWVSMAAVPGPDLLLATLHVPGAIHRAIQCAGVICTETTLGQVLGWSTGNISAIIDYIVRQRMTCYIVSLLVEQAPPLPPTKWVGIKQMLVAAVDTGIFYPSNLPVNIARCDSPEPIYTIPVNTELIRPLREVLNKQAQNEEFATAWAPMDNPRALHELTKQEKKLVAAGWMVGNKRAEAQCFYAKAGTHRNFGQTVNGQREIAYQAANGN